MSLYRKRFKKFFLLLLLPYILNLYFSLFPISCLESKEFSQRENSSSLEILSQSLDPFSILQHMAFFELYPETKEGKRALEHAWKLLHSKVPSDTTTPLALPSLDMQPLVSLITRQPHEPPLRLREKELEIIQTLGNSLANRPLKGAHVWTKKEVLSLPDEEIDVGRGLFLEQFEKKEDIRFEVKQYEAMLDLMALQILVRLPIDATAEDKIREINAFIFQDMQFRFPPHSLYAKDIDLYTFLPSVLDSRQGVCLGVSILYLCLAQRLGLPLEIITPPGHIYLRYKDSEGCITNIETTARGIHLPSETYLGVNTRSLEQRTIKEVIGLAFINQASVYWSKEEYEDTVVLYEKALPYLPNDSLIKMFLGINYLFVGKIKEGRKLLTEIEGVTFDYAVCKETLPEDYLSGKVDIEGMKAIFLSVDEKQSSIVEKQKELQKILERYPQYRAGLLQLATTWLQMGRGKEAEEVLKSYHDLDPHNPIVEYYLSILSLERLHYPLAWFYLKKAEESTGARAHNPKALKALRKSLKPLCPEEE